MTNTTAPLLITLPPVPEELAHLVVPVNRCLHCDYSLAGLPEKHQCPECGQNYDKKKLEIRTGISRSTRIAMTMLYTLCAATTLLCLWAAPAAVPTPALLSMVAIPLLLGIFAVRILHKKQPYCIVSPRGVQMGTRKTAPWVPWTSVATFSAVCTLTGGSQLRVGSRLLGKALQLGAFTMIPANRAERKTLNRWLDKCKTRCRENAKREIVLLNSIINQTESLRHEPPDDWVPHP